MADLTITAANVKLSTGAAILDSGVAGETITRGNVIYEVQNTLVLMKANCDTSTTATPVGIAITDGVVGERIVYVKNGSRYTTGATMTAFTEYVLSNNDGNLMPAGDLATDDFYVPTIRAISTTVAEVSITNTNIQSA